METIQNYIRGTIWSKRGHNKSWILNKQNQHQQIVQREAPNVVVANFSQWNSFNQEPLKCITSLHSKSLNARQA